MTAEEKARIFSKAYKEDKYLINEAETEYFASGLREIIEKSLYADKEILIPYDIFRNPAVTVMERHNAFEYMGELQARSKLNSITGELFCLNQWMHYGKEIFDFDKDLALQLADDAKEFDLDRPVPIEALDKIPGQGLFISTPPIKMFGEFYMDGFFVNKGVTAVTFLSDTKERLNISENITFTAVMFENGLIKQTFSLRQPHNIHGISTLQDALECMIELTRLRANDGGNKGRTKRTEKTLKIFYEFLLYLCAENAEIRNTTPPEKRDEDKSKKTDKSDKPDKPKKNHAPSIKAVGENEGTRIRTYKAKYNKETAYMPRNPNAPKREMPPHMRRSHWHSFWIGKRGTEERRLILKWLPPAYIHPEKMEEARAIVTDIGKDNGEKESESVKGDTL